jgi:hypothetical protein
LDIQNLNVSARRSSEAPGKIRLLFRSLTGFSRQVDQAPQYSDEVTVRRLWEEVSAAFAEDFPVACEPQLLLNRGEGQYELLSPSMEKVCPEAP